MRALIIALLLPCVLCASTTIPRRAGPRTGDGGAQRFPKPPYTSYAEVTRWLTHEADWGVLATVSSAASGAPVGGVVSVSDGPHAAATGHVYFYLTPMDELTQNVQADARASLTVSQAQLPGGCGPTDPEDPTCARASLLGRMARLSGAARSAGLAALVARHPVMASWPADHGFDVWELQVQEAHLLDWYGGMHVVSAADYYAAHLGNARPA